MMAVLRIGTCSWKYESWKGLVYNENTQQDYLRDYASKYCTVEIDQWFWSLHGPDKISLPQPEVVQQYVSSVPSHFRFTIKMANSMTLTHFYKKSGELTLTANPYFLSVDLYEKFLEKLGPMLPLTGILMFQFEYLNKQKLRSQAEFLAQMTDFIRKISRPVPIGIEVRNPNYLNRAFFEFIKENGLVCVFLQGYYMPSIVSVIEEFQDMLHDTIVIRLHGPDRGGIEKKSKGRWDTIIDSKDLELAKIVPLIQKILDQNINVYLNVNNHYEGSAPLTIEKLKKFGLASHSETRNTAI
jgi:uncharacterized protein YecE (DUF72 family)